MAKADDSSLDPEELRAVQVAARRALDRASAWGIYLTPTAVILEAASLKIAPASAFDPKRITEYLLGKAESAAIALKSAIAKVFGIYDAGEQLIHIDDTVHASKQNFLKLHEAGHHELPAQVPGNGIDMPVRKIGDTRSHLTKGFSDKRRKVGSQQRLQKALLRNGVYEGPSLVVERLNFHCRYVH